MSTETTTQAATQDTTPETVDSSNVKETVDPFAKFEFDADELEKIVNSDSGDIVAKVLAERKPLYNEVVDLANTYRAATDIDGSVSEFIENSEDADVKKLAEKLERAKAAVKTITEQLSAMATEKMQAELAPDFDEAQAKRDYQDKVASLKDGSQFLYQLFDMSGHLRSETPAATAENKRPRTVYIAQDEKGEALLKILKGIPSLSNSSSSKPTGEGKIIRQWAESEGLIEKGKVGKLPNDIKEKWEAAGKPGLND